MYVLVFVSASLLYKLSPLFTNLTCIHLHNILYSTYVHTHVCTCTYMYISALHTYLNFHTPHPLQCTVCKQTPVGDYFEYRHDVLCRNCYFYQLQSGEKFTPRFVCMYMCTYECEYVHTYVLTSEYVHTYVHTYVCTYSDVNCYYF